MNYKISNNKLNNLILNMISEEYPVEKSYFDWEYESSKHVAVISFPEPGTEHYVIYFRVFTKEFYQEQLDNSSYSFYRIELEIKMNKAPMLEMYNRSFNRKMDEIFGPNLWRPIFEKWFKESYTIDINTFEYY